jgi:phosphoglycolate phosphatase-like HAD superfamily hydrolase
MWLVLFDVDGTLLLSHDPLVGEAMMQVARELFGVEVDVDALRPGETALRQGRELGLPERGLARWCARVGERYVDLLAHANTSGWRTPDGVEATLAEVARLGKLALLTGNPEPMARARMERLGLARFFPPGQGAFGCEAEERTHLIALARSRAGDWPADETVAVGDTPLDVAGAHAAGIRVVAVESHRFGAEALAGADARISSLSSLPEALSSLRPSG